MDRVRHEGPAQVMVGFVSLHHLDLKRRQLLF